MKQGAEGKDEVLIDPHPMSPDHTTSVTILDVTEDGNVLAYGVRRGGADEMEVHLMDVSQRRDLSDQLPKARYFGVSFKPDKSGLYYSMMGEDAPHVRYHALGTDAKQDAEIFGKGYGPQNIAVADVSEDGRYQDISKKAPIEPLVRDIDARFQANIGGDKIFLQTNWKAPNGRILAVDLHDPARERWREIVPETNS